MRYEVLHEIDKAKAEGLAYTPYRPFLDGDERIGAIRCSYSLPNGRRCRQPSSLVSYSTSIGGRDVICLECFLRSAQPALLEQLKKMRPKRIKER